MIPYQSIVFDETIYSMEVHTYLLTVKYIQQNKNKDLELASRQGFGELK